MITEQKQEKRAERFLSLERENTKAQRGSVKMPKLCCPSCGARLLDAADKSVRRRTRLFLYKEGAHAQYVIKCRVCASAVGIESAVQDTKE